MASYLLQRGSSLYFRLRVPVDVRHAVGCTEIKLTLKTGYKTIVRGKAMLLAGFCLNVFDAVRKGSDISSEWLRKELIRLASDPAISCPQINQAPPVPKITSPAVNEERLPSVAEAVQMYLDESRSKWRERTSATFEPILNEFVEIVDGDRVTVEALDFERMRAYKAAVPRLPKNMQKMQQYRNKSVKDVLSADVPECDRLSERTASRRFVVVKGFLKWLRVNYGIQQSYNELLTLEVQRKANKSSREPFTDAELCALFGSKWFVEKSFDADYKYWVPLIGLYQGMRLNEICQLYLDDIRIVDSIWCFDINDNAKEKIVKTASSRRIVPIHQELVRIGILEYVEGLRMAGALRLFPELNLGRHGYADKPSKWFARYRVACGIDSSTKVFHSFRNTVTTKLKNASVPLGVSAQLLGHSLEKQSMTYDYYAKEYDLHHVAGWLNLLVYNALAL